MEFNNNRTCLNCITECDISISNNSSLELIRLANQCNNYQEEIMDIGRRF